MPVTVHGGLVSCEMLKSTQCLDSQHTEGFTVVSLTRRLQPSKPHSLMWPEALGN
jgi:hypothetical protein